MYIKIIKVSVVSIILTTVFLIKGFAQSNDFLKDYYGIGAFSQFTVDKGGIVYDNNGAKPNFTLKPFIVPQLGITFPVFQYKNWNFKTGFILKYKITSEKYVFTKAQTGKPYDLIFDVDFDSGSKMNAIPLIAEYIMPISKRTKWVISGSFTFAYYRGQEGGSETYLGVNHPNPVTLLIYYDGYEKNPLFTSAEISTGFYFLFKHFMLQPEIRYSKSFRDVLTGHYTTENFLTEPHSSGGTFKQSGDYWGLSLSIYIKKRGKNKKRKKKH
jgi:hypothetical protein